MQMSLAGLIHQARAEAGGILPGEPAASTPSQPDVQTEAQPEMLPETVESQEASADEPAALQPEAQSQDAEEQDTEAQDAEALTTADAAAATVAAPDAPAEEPAALQPEAESQDAEEQDADALTAAEAAAATVAAPDAPADEPAALQPEAPVEYQDTEIQDAPAPKSPAEAFVSMLHKPAARPRSRWSTWSGWDESEETTPARADAATATAAVSPAPSWLRESDASGQDPDTDTLAADADTDAAQVPAATAGAADTVSEAGEAEAPASSHAGTPLFWVREPAAKTTTLAARSWLDEEADGEQDAEDFFPRTAVREDDGEFSPADDADDSVCDEAAGSGPADASGGELPEDLFDDAYAARSGTAGLADDLTADQADETALEGTEDAATGAGGDAPEGAQPSKRRRRGRRGGRNHRRSASSAAAAAAEADSTEAQALVEREAEEPEVRPERPERTEQPAMRHSKRRMYISVLPGEQVEVAITSNGILDEYYLDMLHQKKLKGNIYRGIIVNIDVNLQAAFVDFGAEKNGFLQIDEIHPEYYTSTQEYVRGKKYPPIQKVLRLGQEVLVQVVKEPNGSKGAFLTTWISLAGRFLVLTPGQEQIGISRKVHDEGERNRLRELMNGIDPGDDLGVIVRTVSAGVTQATLKNDLAYLKRTWNEVRRHATGVIAPACVYREPGLPERAVRDYLTEDVCEIWVDNADIAGRIRDTVTMLFPQKRDLVRVHNDARHSLWERFNLRRQLDQIYSREVLMPSGGRLVFDQTEALMAIDINSGKISCKGNFENMAFRTNMEAAETIARQLKLRDIGGQVVIDFIEMREHKHVVEVERTLRNAMKNDKARHDVSRMSSFGLLELVRQRTGTSAISISMEPCPACGGTGLRRNLEWQSLQALRDIARIMRSRASSPCRYEMTQELGLYVLNHKRDSLKELEKLYGKNIEIVIRP